MRSTAAHKTAAYRVRPLFELAASMPSAGSAFLTVICEAVSQPPDYEFGRPVTRELLSDSKLLEGRSLIMVGQSLYLISSCMERVSAPLGLSKVLGAASAAKPHDTLGHC